MFLDWKTKQKELQERLDQKAKEDKAKGKKVKVLSQYDKMLGKTQPKDESNNIPDSRKIDYNKILDEVTYLKISNKM